MCVCVYMLAYICMCVYTVRYQAVYIRTAAANTGMKEVLRE